MILGPGVGVPETVGQHRVRMLADDVLDVVCLGRAASCRVLNLLGRPFCLKLNSVRLQMPHLFSVAAVEHFSFSSA